ncbi:MAG: hypothetical protein CFH01_01607 [Alphaproteobacteria bacterium MarineAlpha2_Bin1]|nr:MAG: hypothetical protein CFH01_01607 [Alphaproteobacteria bacterium MarineAlpha2_Bin1]|tara:strand:+ start:2125 stop:2796 length:672 start_codon:yes stop_codon:yes gene_type:complete
MNELSIIIPTLNSEKTLESTIRAVIEKANIYVVDGGSTDSTISIANRFSARVTVTLPSRGLQLLNGANLVSKGWVLFLHSDTFLSDGWHEEVLNFIKMPDSSKKVGYFKFRFDDDSFIAKLVEICVSLRCRIFSLPYGDQCLLIHKSLYNKIGGFKPISLMEDVDLISRIEKKHLYNIPVSAITSSSKYKKKGYFYTTIKNLVCLLMFKLGFSIHFIKLIYDS